MYMYMYLVGAPTGTSPTSAKSLKHGATEMGQPAPIPTIPLVGLLATYPEGSSCPPGGHDEY